VRTSDVHRLSDFLLWQVCRRCARIIAIHAHLCFFFWLLSLTSIDLVRNPASIRENLLADFWLQGHASYSPELSTKGVPREDNVGCHHGGRKLTYASDRYQLGKMMKPHYQAPRTNNKRTSEQRLPKSPRIPHQTTTEKSVPSPVAFRFAASSDLLS
jgi:hypothetical protein